MPEATTAFPYRLPANHPAISHGRIGVLLVNLGTPDATDIPSIRRYLKEFLSDRRVIEVPAWIWQIILRLFILTFRPAKTAHAYRQIWRKESNESPLRYYTRSQAEKLAELYASSPNIKVDWAMRYGSPSIASRIAALHRAGCDRIFLLPLYPQYAAATTATVADETFRSLMRMRWQPALRVAPGYHDHPLYIEALAASVREHLTALEWEPQTILASFHGIPQAYFDKGDPYYCYCHKTARLLREKLGMSEEKLRLTFQSRFGPKEWLKPYTDVTLTELPAEGVTRVAVIAPGFAADCVETLEELGIRGHETFMEKGGTHYTLIPCLNDDASHIALLKALTDEGISGWASGT